jgi:hypothetical protein
MYYATEIFKQAGLNDQRASLLATGIKNNFRFMTILFIMCFFLFVIQV